MLLEAMFLNPGGLNPRLIILAIAVIGLIVGNAWLRRIAGPDPDRQPSAWRYRDVRIPRQWPTTGWLATRLGMTLAAVVFLIVLAAPAIGLAPASPLWLASVVLAAIGATWIFRIARANPEAGTPPWRYRER
jgi:hypothetical protein